MAPADETPSIGTGALHMSLTEIVDPRRLESDDDGRASMEAALGFDALDPASDGRIYLNRQVEMARNYDAARRALDGYRNQTIHIRGMEEVMADVEELSYAQAFLTAEGQVSLLELARELQEMGHLDLAEEIRDDIAEIVADLAQ